MLKVKPFWSIFPKLTYIWIIEMNFYIRIWIFSLKELKQFFIFFLISILTINIFNTNNLVWSILIIYKLKFIESYFKLNNLCNILDHSSRTITRTVLFTFSTTLFLQICYLRYSCIEKNFYSLQFYSLF